MFWPTMNSIQTMHKNNNNKYCIQEDMTNDYMFDLQ